MTNGTDRTGGSLPPDAWVVAVGAGVIGASVAFQLAEAGARDVLVLDRDGPASGSSGKPIRGVRARFRDSLNSTLGQRGFAASRDFLQLPGVGVVLGEAGYLFPPRDGEKAAACAGTRSSMWRRWPPTGSSSRANRRESAVI
ncbi:FAD-dependent oxidoreductase [Streptantibioticus rubrisoli]|uniref:FAD-binding oxidoreductase n=1 Tax=Streptantibioticus rubrisoli TaxID=1387313 RepID=A0ABT1P8W5_9ACTN|nr:FAD-dependent oxidoreductase [Streptantibioticus rubrisoli]MCQ4040785.1 FAD-binding oxidoreductase [Streptantibioticus rubrisoli]